MNIRCSYKKSVFAIAAVLFMVCAIALTGCGKPYDINGPQLPLNSSIDIEKSEKAQADEEKNNNDAKKDTKKEQKIDYSAYDEMISKAAGVIFGDHDNTADSPEDISIVFSYSGGYEELGYLRKDLDGDGIEELIFGGNSDNTGYNGIIYDLYTIKDGKLVQVLDGWERNSFFLCKNGCIANEAAGGADIYSLYYYTYSDSQLNLIEAVNYDAYYDEDSPWFYSKNKIDAMSDYERDDIIHITEKEAQSIMDSYEHVELRYTPFSEKDVKNGADKTQNETEGQDDLPVMINDDEMIYYSGSLIGGKDEFYDSVELGCIVSVEKQGNKLVLYASLNKSEEFYEENADYKDYAQYIFTLDDDIKYYGTGGTAPEPTEVTQEMFYETCKSYNGLSLVLKVEKGAVVEAYLCS